MGKALGLAVALGLALCGVVFGLNFGQTQTCAAAEIGLPCGYARVRGVVRAADTGQPLSGVAVSMQYDGGFSLSPAFTDATGSYTVTAFARQDLPTIHLSFEKFGGVYAPLVLDNKIAFVSGTVTVISDVRLVKASTISGTLKAQGSDATINSGVLVSLIPIKPDGQPDLTRSTSRGVRFGKFTFEGLAAGRYTMLFAPNAESDLRRAYLGNAQTITDAQRIDVGVGQTREVTATIGTGFHLGGKVTRQDTGDLVGEMVVSVYDADTNLLIKEGSFDSGDYTVKGMASGRYVVHVAPPLFVFPGNPSFGVIPSFYSGTVYRKDATVVVITNADRTNVDMALRFGSTVTGTVRDAVTGNPLENILVTLVASPTMDLVNAPATSTDDRGRYTLTNVPPGRYTVKFSTVFSPYATQYYLGQDDEHTAQLISVTSEVSLTNINASMHLGGTISGRITGTDGKPLKDQDGIPQFFIVEFSHRNSQGVFEFEGAEFVPNSGIFTHTKLLPGDYIVSFLSSPACGCYVNRDYSTSGAPGDRTIVTLPDYGATRAGINIQIAKCDVLSAATGSHIFVPLIRR